MPPKLKLAAATTPPKKKPRAKKEPGVESITSALSTINVAAPAFKSYSMATLDGYMVKPYCQNFIDHVEVDIHVAGVLKEHCYKVELSTDCTSLIWR